MPWQDVVITIGQTIFAVALIPSIIGKDKPALTSSLVTGTFLIIFAFTFATLSLWLAVISSTINGVLWFILAYQKHNKRV